jgi:hypothetical protein
MVAAKKLKPVEKETFRIPRKSTEALSALVADVRTKGGVVLRKTYIIMGLLDLLGHAKIDPRKIRSESDLIEALKEKIAAKNNK